MDTSWEPFRSMLGPVALRAPGSPWALYGIIVSGLTALSRCFRKTLMLEVMFEAVGGGTAFPTLGMF